jgi:hypothetical protein
LKYKSFAMGLIRFFMSLFAMAVGATPLLAGPIPVASSRSVEAYAFRVNSRGWLLDESGRPVAPPDVAACLKRLNVSTTTIALWIENAEAIKLLEPTIEAFEGKFSSIIVKFWQPGDQTGLISLPSSSTPPSRPATMALYPGRSYPVSAEARLLSERPGPLQPGQPPPVVRYRYAGNAVVEKAAALVTGHFLGPVGRGADDWASTVLVQCGAWKCVRSDEVFGPNFANQSVVKVPGPGGLLEIQQAILNDRRQIEALDTKLRRMIAADGGGQVRALRTDEMKMWWQVIFYDILEPLYVVETANSNHRFIIGVNQDGIGMVDELNALSGVLDTAKQAAAQRKIQTAAVVSPVAGTPLILKAGQSAILVGGQSARFPGGTTVSCPGGGTVTVQGHHNTVNATAGTIVAVPLNATGEADNVVIAP